MIIDDDVYLCGFSFGEFYCVVEIYFYWGFDNGVGLEYVFDDY